MHRPTRTRDELALVVRTAVSDVIGAQVDDLDDTTSLADGYGLDSLELMEIGARLERAVGLRLQVADLASAKTIGHTVALLQARLAEQR